MRILQLLLRAIHLLLHRRLGLGFVVALTSILLLDFGHDLQRISEVSITERARTSLFIFANLIFMASTSLSQQLVKATKERIAGEGTYRPGCLPAFLAFGSPAHSDTWPNR